MNLCYVLVSFKKSLSQQKTKNKKNWRNLSVVAPSNFIHLEKKSPCVSLQRLEETHLPDEFMNRKLSYLKIKVS